MSFTRFRSILAVIGLGTLIAIGSIATLELLKINLTLNTLIETVGGIYGIGAVLFSVLSVLVVLYSAYSISQNEF
ncbi:hypothetical protein [Halolamina salifodinae]|uniref:Uncharacterized protein n=1 Tax=Halolamina salifodinae TaxID=1202767 RepID=A0A8T4GV46_9EURY|nr:hypothetical protein [Halolamina salifodinae]MBP1987001.1 hypothetical protein [Halolamina salifodinae]